MKRVFWTLLILCGLFIYSYPIQARACGTLRTGVTVDDGGCTGCSSSQDYCSGYLETNYVFQNDGVACSSCKVCNLTSYITGPTGVEQDCEGECFPPCVPCHLGDTKTLTGNIPVYSCI
jgi:hypothetical protein